MSFEAIRCTLTTWESTLRIFGLFHESWIFRGQSNREWTLETSLERYSKAKREIGHGRIMAEAEAQMLREIQSQSHFRIGQTSQQMTEIDWLALLQHHGGVTRLLDFTRSVYVALFFAIEGASSRADGKDSAVWAIDRRPLWKQMAKLAGVTDSDVVHVDASDAINRRIRHDNSEMGVAIVEPSISSERMAIQQGLFLVNLSHYNPFDAALQYVYPNLQALSVPLHHTDSDKLYEALLTPAAKAHPPVSIKFIVPKELRFKMLSQLRAMNITSNTLFPGLDGFARSLNFLATGYRNIDQLETMD